MARDPVELTTLLDRVHAGDREAEERLASRIYDELHDLAGAYMRRERPDHTLQATALVNEAWAELLGGGKKAGWESRKAFFAHAAKIMRHALIDHARGAERQKRGGGKTRQPFEVVVEAYDGQPLDAAAFTDLHSALETLAQVDARAARVVELRFFAGLTNEQAADVLGMSRATVENDFRAARVWLRNKLSDGR